MVSLVDLSEYLLILLFLGVALVLSSAFVFLPMLVSSLTGTHKPNPDKLAEYECGFPAFEDPRSQFDVRFYLVAILFIVFRSEEHTSELQSLMRISYAVFCLKKKKKKMK